MKKNIFKFVIGFIFTFLLCFTVSYNFSDAVILDSTSKHGNTNGNFYNNALVAQSGEWIYYVENKEDYSLYKINQNGTGKIKLDSGSCKFINVVGEWIYYLKNKILYIQKTDGTMLHKIDDYKCDTLLVDGDIIYRSRGKEIFWCKTDGSNRVSTDVPGSSFDYLQADQNYIYYSSFTIDKLPKKFNKNARPISFQHALDFVVDKDVIYFIDNPGDSDFKLYKCNKDGKNIKKVSDYKCDQINLDDKYIYFSSQEDDNILYRMTKDGKNRILLSNEIMEKFNLTNNYIYYISYGNLMKFTDTMKDGIILAHNTYGTTITSDKIYYLNRKKSIFSMNKDGTNSKVVVKNGSLDYLVKDGWIYYVDNKNQIHKVDVNGKNEKQFKTFDVHTIFQIVGNYLYFFSLHDMDFDNYTEVVRKVSLDGKNESTVPFKSVPTNGFVIDGETEDRYFFKDNIYVVRNDSHKIYKRSKNYKLQDDRVNTGWIGYYKEGDPVPPLINIDEAMDGLEFVDNDIYYYTDSGYYKFDTETQTITPVILYTDIYGCKYDNGNYYATVAVHKKITKDGKSNFFASGAAIK